MAIIFQIFVAVILTCGPSLLYAAENGGMAMVETLKFEELEDSERVVIGLSGEVETRIFELPGKNPRVVCDLLHTGYPADLRRVISTHGDIARRIRVGIHNAPVVKTRIVIDLADDVEYAFDHSFREEDNILVLTLSQKSAPKSVAELLTELQKTRTAAKEEQKKTEETEKAENAKEAEETTEVEETEQTLEPSIAMPESQEPAREEEKKPVEEVQDEADGSKESPDLTRGEDRELTDTADDDIAILHDVAFERNTNDKEMVLFRLNGFYPPVIFSTEDNDLLVVCDFLDAVLGDGVEPVVETGGKYIKRIRVTKHDSPEKVRVVLDLTDRYNYDLKQVFFREDNLFVVIISNIGEKE